MMRLLGKDREMRTLSLWLLSSLIIAACGGGVPDSPQQAERPATTSETPTAAPAAAPAVSINAVMVDWVDHAAHALWNVEVQAPKDERGWREVERHATQLAAAGTLIALGGTGQADPGWAKLPAWGMYSRQLTDVGLTAFNAARNRNLGDLTKNNERLLATCESCHKEFKPDSPTEGRVHDPE